MVDGLIIFSMNPTISAATLYDLQNIVQVDGHSIFFPSKLDLLPLFNFF